MECNCEAAETRKSGGSPFSIGEFTKTYQSWYSFSNYHVVDIITCSNCKTNWLLISDFTDRPPYWCMAIKLSLDDLSKILELGKEKMDLLISDGGPLVLKSLLAN